MKKVTLIVRSIVGDRIKLALGSFYLTFSKRSPYLKGMRFKVGEKIKLTLSKR